MLVLLLRDVLRLLCESLLALPWLILVDLLLILVRICIRILIVSTATHCSKEHFDQEESTETHKELLHDFFLLVLGAVPHSVQPFPRLVED